MAAFLRIELWSALQCQGGSKLAVFYPQDLKDGRTTNAIDDQESLTFVCDRVDRTGVTNTAVAQLRVRRIATVVWDDGSFDEWRIAVIDDGHGLGGVITVTCNPLILDLAEGADSSTGKGLVSTTALCLRVFNFGVQSLTATQVWDTYVIPNCPSWVTRGTIDPTAVIPQLQWDRLTPQALALQVRDTLRKMNVSCEIRLRRNGTTDYKLDLITQIGSGAATPLFYPRTNLKTLKRRTDAAQQSTRLFVTGETDPSGVAGIPGRARWKVTNVDGANKKLTLADPNGGAGPIGMTSQWLNNYVVRCLTCRSFQIQASDPAAQTVTLLDVSTFATDEMVEFRLTEPSTNARTIANPNTRYAISSVSTNNLTLSGNPITVTNEYVDWYAKVWTASSGGSVVGTPQRISASVAASDVITVASGSGFNNTHFVEFIQLDGAGELPSYLDHATQVQAPPTGYGMKAGDLMVSTVLGVTNYAKNAWMRTWTNSSNPPDGYTTSGAGSGFSQNTNPLFTRYGGLSFKADFGGVSPLLFNSPRFDPVLAPGNTRLSVRAFVFFDTFTVTAADHLFTMEVWALAADGVNTIGSALGINQVAPANFGGATTATKVGVNAWVTMEIVGMDLSAEKAPYGIMVRFSDITATVANECIAYIDSIEAYGFAANPDVGNVYEFGDASLLHQAGNRQLSTNASPPIAYEVEIADLERQDPTNWSVNALTLGGNVRTVDPDISVDTTVRLLRIERDLLQPMMSTVGLSNLPALLLRLVQTT